MKIIFKRTLLGLLAITLCVGQPASLISIIALLLSACSGGGSTSAVSTASAASASSVGDMITIAQSSGAIPTLDFGTSLLGTDANGNGVRDDVEAYINSLPDTPAQKAALMQDSAAINATLVVDVTNPAALANASKLISNASDCEHYVYDTLMKGTSSYNNLLGYNRGREIEKYTVNTPQRFKAYMLFNQAMSGTMISMTRGGVGCAK